MTKLKAQPAPVQEFGLTRERFNALEAEITTLQADWLFAVKEVVRLKAAQPAQEPVAYRSRLQSGSYMYCDTPQFFDNPEPLHTTPQRPWVDLTEDQIKVIEEMALTKQWAIRMTIAQLKECNT